MSYKPTCMYADVRAFVYEYEWAYAWGWNEIFKAEYMSLLSENFKNSLGN